MTGRHGWREERRKGPIIQPTPPVAAATSAHAGASQAIM